MNETKNFLGRGFSFPPEVDKITGRFKMVDSEEDIRQAVYIILMTRMNERAMKPDFGCDLTSYIYELPSASFENLLCHEVQDALTSYEPRIRNVRVLIDTKDLLNGTIYLNISYDVRATNNPNNLVFPYYLDEGIGEL